MSARLSRRGALMGSAAAALGLGTGVVAASAAPTVDADLIARAEAFRALCVREAHAWGGLDVEDPDEGPAVEACRALSQACRDAGAALAEMPARTPAGLAAKASAMLTLVGPRLDTQAALSEHEAFVVSILRDAAGGKGAPSPIVVPSSVTVGADARLRIMADRLDTLQAHADCNAAAAGTDPSDPYTQAVAEMDLVASGMAMMRADTLGGVLLKLRAMAVPIVADDDEAHGLALSVCRDLRRLHGAGRIAHA